MKKINYSLIISDFDHTLVRNDGTISAEDKAAISQYVQAGGHFAISTGRMPAGILQRAKELGLHGLVSCCQGSIVMDIDTQKPLLQGTISKENALAICEKFEELGLHIHIYDDWNYYSNMDDEALRLYEKGVRVKAKLVTDRPLSQFIRETDMPIYKILAMVLPEHNDYVYQAISALQLPDCCVTRSAAYLVEVTNAQYSKGTAVEFLANYYNVPLEKTIAVGDQWNDLPMIERAGLGLAVKNAAKELKERAVCLDKTNEEGAIAQVIYTYGLQ